MDSYNNETFYTLLQNNEFEKLLELEQIHRNEIKEDSIVKDIFNKYLIKCVLEYIKTCDDKIYSSIILKSIYNRFIQHRNKTYSIPDSDFELLVYEYISILKAIDKNKSAYIISQKWVHLEIAENFIEEFEKSNPSEIKHSYDANIRVSENTNIRKNNSTIKLFKSSQEYEFFYSIIDYYPNYFTYPNVAVSCIINYDEIKNELTNKNQIIFLKR